MTAENADMHEAIAGVVWYLIKQREVNGLGKTNKASYALYSHGFYIVTFSRTVAGLGLRHLRRYFRLVLLHSCTTEVLTSKNTNSKAMPTNHSVHAVSFTLSLHFVLVIVSCFPAVVHCVSNRTQGMRPRQCGSNKEKCPPGNCRTVDAQFRQQPGRRTNIVCFSAIVQSTGSHT